MVSKNSNGKYAVKERKPISWRTYDNLHPAIKGVLQEAPFNVVIGGFRKGIKNLGPERFAAELKKRIDEVSRESCLLMYGPDHPQAK